MFCFCFDDFRRMNGKQLAARKAKSEGWRHPCGIQTSTTKTRITRMKRIAETEGAAVVTVTTETRMVMMGRETGRGATAAEGGEGGEAIYLQG